MHTTYVKTKDGKEYSGAIKTWRPALNWFTLFNVDKKFSFDDCISIVTPHERVNIKSPPEGEFQDNMRDAHKWLETGRDYNWTEKDEDGTECPYPKERYAWESQYVTSKPKKRKTK
jgi:hypothetical protein